MCPRSCTCRSSASLQWKVSQVVHGYGPRHRHASCCREYRRRPDGGVLLSAGLQYETISHQPCAIIISQSLTDNIILSSLEATTNVGASHGCPHKISVMMVLNYLDSHENLNSSEILEILNGIFGFCHSQSLILSMYTATSSLQTRLGDLTDITRRGSDVSLTGTAIQVSRHLVA